MTDNFKHLVRKNIYKLIPYQSARSIKEKKNNIQLNANESPMPIFFQLRQNFFNRYPDSQPKDLIFAYANYINISSDQILVTRGADEGIELLIKAFCEPGKDAIICCPPTYDMYRVAGKIAGVQVKEIPTIKNSWQLDLCKIQKNLNQVKLIFICNPNNPTGNIISKKDLVFLLKISLNHTLVVIDEAYIEFSLKNSMIYFLEKYSNLIILRTLSKAFGLAGIRCGFTLANKDIISILKKIISPYPISIPVSDIAFQALKENYIQLMRDRVIMLNDNRLWLVSQLRQLSCIENIFESHANYILVRFFMCEKIFQTLWDKGIILRNQSEKIYLKNCLRISIGTYSECIILLDILKSF